jgi:hypothetical protein
LQDSPFGQELIMAQIRRFGVGQMAMVLGVLYVLIGVIFLPIFFIVTALSPAETGFGMGFALSLPLIYGVAGFISGAVGAFLYNIVAGWVGGIEVELENAGV